MFIHELKIEVGSAKMLIVSTVGCLLSEARFFVCDRSMDCIWISDVAGALN